MNYRGYKFKRTALGDVIIYKGSRPVHYLVNSDFSKAMTWVDNTLNPPVEQQPKSKFIGCPHKDKPYYCVKCHNRLCFTTI